MVRTALQIDWAAAMIEPWVLKLIMGSSLGDCDYGIAGLWWRKSNWRGGL
jgi:hypothetical protein